MVTILSVALMLASGTEQERCTSPLMCTEQAPHCATPQPYFVPVSPTCSRTTHRRGVSPSARTSTVLPLMLSLAIAAFPRVARPAGFVLVGWRPSPWPRQHSPPAARLPTPPPASYPFPHS